MSPECHWCHTTLDFNETTLDHIIPRSKGGRGKSSNVVLSCKSCNQKRSNWDYDDLSWKLRVYSQKVTLELSEALMGQLYLKAQELQLPFYKALYKLIEDSLD